MKERLCLEEEGDRMCMLHKNHGGPHERTPVDELSGEPEITQELSDAFALRLALEMDTASADEIAAYLLDETTALHAMEIAEQYCERGYADVVRNVVAGFRNVAPQHLCDDFFIKASAGERLIAWLKFMGQ